MQGRMKLLVEEKEIMQRELLSLQKQLDYYKVHCPLIRLIMAGRNGFITKEDEGRKRHSIRSPESKATSRWITSISRGLDISYHRRN